MSACTALTRVFARLGLERILRRIRQFLVSELARSPGPRRQAWAVLTSFCSRERRLWRYSDMASTPSRSANVTGRTTGWKAALNALALFYGERITLN
jgi:hypothetical protein